MHLVVLRGVLCIRVRWPRIPIDWSALDHQHFCLDANLRIRRDIPIQSDGIMRCKTDNGIGIFSAEVAKFTSIEEYGRLVAPKIRNLCNDNTVLGILQSIFRLLAEQKFYVLLIYHGVAVPKNTMKFYATRRNTMQHARIQLEYMILCLSLEQDTNNWN